MVVVKDWCRCHLVGKDSPQYRVDWLGIYKMGVENIDWRGDWECTTAVDVGSGQEGHSCVSDSGKVWVLLEVVDFLGMRLQFRQRGYIVGK